MPPPPPQRCGPGFGPCYAPGQCCNPVTGTCTSEGPGACASVHALSVPDGTRAAFADRYDAAPAPMLWAAAQAQAHDEMIAAGWRDGVPCVGGASAAVADFQVTQRTGVGKRCGSATNATCPWRAGAPDLCCVEDDPVNAPLQGTCAPCEAVAGAGKRLIVWDGAWMYA